MRREYFVQILITFVKILTKFLVTWPEISGYLEIVVHLTFKNSEKKNNRTL